MKKIKNKIFMCIAILLGVFMLSSNKVKAVEEVVFNPDSNGNGAHIYEGVQYTSARDIDIKINMDEEVLQEYDTMFRICEYIPASTINNTRSEEKCATYSTDNGVKRFQLSGRGDGEKTINIYFYNDYNPNVVNDSVVKTIEKKIVLDTTGPIIELIGGEYIYLLQSEDYEELGATCIDDSGVANETCTPVIGEANIDKTKEGFQYIRYSAEDFLGNEVIVTRKIVVEMPKEKKDYTYWYTAGGGVIVLALFLGWVVIKNKEKQKQQSSVL